MELKKIVFMGTPEFAVPALNALSETRFKPVLCITQPDRPKGRKRKLQPTPVKIAAEQLNIPVIQPEDVNKIETLDQLSEIAPDIIITVAYGGYLKKQIRLLAKFGCINLHPSLLPKYRGPAPINYALFNGDKITGNTIFKIVSEMDSGPIIFQTQTEIEETDCYTTLYKKLSENGTENIIKVLKNIEQNGLVTNKQDHTKVTFSHKLLKEDLLLNWNDTAENIRNRVRGLAEIPGITASFKENRIKIIEIEILDLISQELPGTILDVGKNGIIIVTADKNILLKKVQPAGKGIMTAHAFSLGARIKAEDRFHNGF
ncbi:MAG: methionyl-tRNA formyltransferase [Candidatus Tenebribacter davisii]|jgi:methionyl-tRNA formyltransferase|nr:methionyl-tRNA formyltransferase [Candidatus Tenebribacter davisii]